MKLFDIAPAIRDAQAKVDSWAEEHDGNVTECPDLWALLGMEFEREQKLLSLGCLVLEIEAEAEAHKEIQRAQAEKAATATAKADRLRELIANHLKPGEKIKDARVGLGWRKSDRLVMDENVNPAELPDDFKRVKVEADKAAIKEAIKAGAEFDFAKIETKQNLQIK